MFDFRIVKTRWYHRAWEYIFKPGDPSGFETGWLICKLYLDGTTGKLFRLPPGLPQRIADEFEKEYKAKQETEPEIVLSEHDGKRQEVHEKQRTNTISVFEPLEHDPERTSRRGMGQIPGRSGRH